MPPVKQSIFLKARNSIQPNIKPKPNNFQLRRFSDVLNRHLASAIVSTRQIKNSQSKEHHKSDARSYLNRIAKNPINHGKFE